jgi:ribosomal protein S18 acetylase RimI-like enzyme
VADLAIGDLRADEIDAAVALWREVGLTRPWNDPHADARLALGGPTSTILAGRLDGRLVATVMVGADGHRGWVYYLGVAADRLRNGYGAAMMHAAEQWIVARGLPKLQLMVREDNAAAIGFYEAIGYKTEAVSVLSKRFDGR